MPTLATLKDIAKFFDIAPTQFRHELSKLSPSDVMELKTGIGDTTLNY